MVADVAPHTAGVLWLIPAIPLAVAMLNLFVGQRLGRWAGILATLAVFASFAVAVAAVRDLLAFPGEERLALQHLFDWISVGGFRVGADLRLDTLSATMILVVTGIGALIHLYSIGYMSEDPRRGRFFAYMNLFVFFMLMLVLGANYLVLYLGWEGVGLCSFLLIGFWFEDTRNAEAAKKAFITTRIGDTLMLIGLAMLVFKFGTLDFVPIFGTAATVLTKDAATVIALLLLAGAIGKSAQLPLQVWLPDAMAGPTPVSALIHAATMVTAGVYLVIRSHVLFELSGVALTVVLVIGLATAFFAATCAIAQFDIKRVLAYSTISQLGYMFIAVGMRAYGVALFFLVAHAFYKALMFLGAGSVIHGMHDEQDMRQMGGLRAAMPITCIAFAVGGLAQAGVPPLAGFFAKDAILEVANHTGRQAVYVIVTITAFLTAFYIGRMLIMTFFGAAAIRTGGARARVAVGDVAAARDPRRRRRGDRAARDLAGRQARLRARTGGGHAAGGRRALVRGARRDRRGGVAARARSQLVDLRVGPGRPGGVPRSLSSRGPPRPNTAGTWIAPTTSCSSSPRRRSPGSSAMWSTPR